MLPDLLTFILVGFWLWVLWGMQGQLWPLPSVRNSGVVLSWKLGSKLGPNDRKSIDRVKQNGCGVDSLAMFSSNLASKMGHICFTMCCGHFLAQILDSSNLVSVKLLFQHTHNTLEPLNIWMCGSVEKSHQLSLMCNLIRCNKICTLYVIDICLICA